MILRSGKYLMIIRIPISIAARVAGMCIVQAQGLRNSLSFMLISSAALAMVSCAPTRDQIRPGWVIAERPIPCGEWRGAYCFLNLDVGVREVQVDSNQTILALDDPENKEVKAFVVEPKACHTSLASKVILVGSGENVDFRGDNYSEVDIRLNENGCTLKNYFKVISGPAGKYSGAVTLMILARPCLNRACDGRPFADFLPELGPPR